MKHLNYIRDVSERGERELSCLLCKCVHAQIGEGAVSTCVEPCIVPCDSVPALARLTQGSAFCVGPLQQHMVKRMFQRMVNHKWTQLYFVLAPHQVSFCGDRDEDCVVSHPDLFSLRPLLRGRVHRPPAGLALGLLLEADVEGKFVATRAA
jgi:hypothetical protein